MTKVRTSIRRARTVTRGPAFSSSARSSSGCGSVASRNFARSGIDEWPALLVVPQLLAPEMPSGGARWAAGRSGSVDPEMPIDGRGVGGAGGGGVAVGRGAVDGRGRSGGDAGSGAGSGVAPGVAPGVGRARTPGDGRLGGSDLVRIT